MCDKRFNRPTLKVEELPRPELAGMSAIALKSTAQSTP
jgi:hypothetical protein